MKGKYATRAQGTQARIDAQQRAESNEQRVQTLEGQIAKMGAKHAKALQGFEKDLTKAISQRDAVTSPALMKASQRIKNLEAEREALREKVASIQDRWDTISTRIVETLVGLGMTEQEAFEAMMNVSGWTHATIVADFAEKKIGKTHGPEAVRRIQAARRWRHGGSAYAPGEDPDLPTLEVPETAITAAAEAHTDLLKACATA